MVLKKVQRFIAILELSKRKHLAKEQKFVELSQAHADILKERSEDLDALKFIRRVTELVLGPNLAVSPHAMLTQERHGAKSEEMEHQLEAHYLRPR
jgi:hypothetical protein